MTSPEPQFLLCTMEIIVILKVIVNGFVLLKTSAVSMMPDPLPNHTLNSRKPKLSPILIGVSSDGLLVGAQ